MINNGNNHIKWLNKHGSKWNGKEVSRPKLDACTLKTKRCITKERTFFYYDKIKHWKRNY